MSAADVEVRWTPGGYQVVFHVKHARKVDALEHATNVAKHLGSEVFNRGKDGTWIGRNTYPRRRDPRRSKG